MKFSILTRTRLVDTLHSCTINVGTKNTHGIQFRRIIQASQLSFRCLISRKASTADLRPTTRKLLLKLWPAAGVLKLNNRSQKFSFDLFVPFFVENMSFMHKFSTAILPFVCKLQLYPPVNDLM